jgi:hypothetical protein
MSTFICLFWSCVHANATSTSLSVARLEKPIENFVMKTVDCNVLKRSQERKFLFLFDIKPSIVLNDSTSLIQIIFREGSEIECLSVKSNTTLSGRFSFFVIWWKNKLCSAISIGNAVSQEAKFWSGSSSAHYFASQTVESSPISQLQFAG